VSMGVYALVQERMMTLPYGGHVLFPCSLFLVFFTRFSAVILGAFVMWLKGESWRSQAPHWKYLLIAFTNTVGSFLQYEALEHISFPAQSIGKAPKSLLVMVWCMRISSRRHSMKEWAIAVIVTTGAIAFLNAGSVSSTSQFLAESAGRESLGYIGLTQIAASVILDSITPAMQEHLFDVHVSKYNQIFWVNLGGSLMALAACLVRNDFGPTLKFMESYPVWLRDTLILTGSAVSAQYFIYSQIEDFGAVTFAVTMNARQTVSAFVSIGIYRNAISVIQSILLMLILAVLLWRGMEAIIEDGSVTKGEKMSLLALPKGVSLADTATEDSDKGSRLPEPALSTRAASV